MDLDGRFGAIQRLYFYKNEIIAFQTEAVSQIAINPRVQVQGDDGIGIYLGTGGLLHDFHYITDKSGTIDKFSIVDNKDLLIFYDNRLNTLNLIDGTQFSTLTGVKGILDENKGLLINAVYDIKNEQFLFLFRDFALIYDTQLKAFTSRHILNNHEWLMVLDDLVLSEDFTNQNLMALYEASTVKESNITYLMCPAPIYEKVFHNLEYRLTGNEFSQIQVDNVRSTSGLVPVDVKNKFDIHRIHLPRVEGSRERFRGISIFVKLLNTGDYALDDMTLMYNIKG